MILVDRPVWARDGRRFAHLASDVSRAELDGFVAAFAARLDLARTPRFHGDHYDVPEEWWAEVVAEGAVVVPTRELVTRLRQAGLRRAR